MVELMKIMATSFKNPMHVLLHSLPPTLYQANNTRLHWRLPDAPGEVWVSLLWGHCSFFLSPGTHKVVFVLSKRLFPSPM